ncbi:MAG: hypothetical protein KC457_12645, partial [Myxococcales bacterium]|nr:hypothetical protein [Myxococcales bacterium]
MMAAKKTDQDDPPNDPPSEADERIASVHEGIVQLALRIPRTVVQAIFSAAGLTLDPQVTIQERNPQRQVPSFVRRARISRADAMWTLHLDGKIVAAIIFEVQIVKSSGKVLDWA